MVIALNSADPGFEDPDVEAGNIAQFRQIAASLKPRPGQDES